MPDDFIFYDSREADDELNLPISFDPIVAGEVEERNIFVKNVSGGEIFFKELTVDSDEVEVKSFTEKFTDDDIGKIVLSFEANMTERKPVEAEIVFDYNVTFR